RGREGDVPEGEEGSVEGRARGSRRADVRAQAGAAEGALKAGLSVYFLALAADYDGTLAHGGVVDRETQNALVRLKETGRRLILVTGRELEDLKSVCRELDMFDRVVVENGALLYDPADGTERLLGEPPPAL